MLTHSTATLAAENTTSSIPPDVKEKVELPVETDSEIQVVLDDDHPQRMSNLRKWLIIIVISCASLCVTCLSSVVRGSLRISSVFFSSH